MKHISRNCRSEGPIRTELVERVRREIQAGTYDTEEKLQIALQRLFLAIGEDELAEDLSRLDPPSPGRFPRQ